MNFDKLQMLLLALFGHRAAAAVLAAPTPAITPAPLVARAVTTVGFMSIGTARGTTVWDTITITAENLIAATSGSIYRVCDPSISGGCDFFSCSGSYVVFPTTSIVCEGPRTCSSYILASDIEDRSPLTNFWCDTVTGGTIYKTKPGGTTVRPPTTSPITSTSSSSSTSISTSTSPVPTPTPAPSKSSPPVGAIVGGVVGGIAVLGAIVVAALFLFRRKRKSPPQPTNNQYHQQPQPVAQIYNPPMSPMSPQQFYNPAQQTYPEKTAAITNTQVSQYYGDSGPSSPAPQYTPATMPVPPTINELPANRM
ncbi:hypothetical protein BKA66DRAFT_203812 [Pyrenochaeta sp. MPI-SDFR-AT-0127]|nr:hypothetical protein BKA66DRAFT_203812 [Pyrenochaeta sp. MPI-SDFR-AT-0127]